MSHPYGNKKAEVLISETDLVSLQHGGSSLRVLEFRGRPYRIAQRIVLFLLERKYCLVGDIVFWAITYRREGKESLAENKKVTITIDPNGGEKDAAGTEQL